VYEARSQLDHLSLHLKKTKDDCKESECRLKTVRDRIKDVWQTQCESYLYDTQAVSAVVDSFSQVIGWVEFISAEMSQQKQSISQLKDERYQMLQTISNLNDLRGDSKGSRPQS
jgi:hypothetical protein